MGLIIKIVRTGILVDEAFGERKVDDAGQLVGRGGRGLFRAKAGFHAPVESAEGCGGTVQSLSSQTESGRGSVRGSPTSGVQHPATGLVGSGTEAEPGAEVLVCGKAGQVDAAFGDDRQDRQNLNAGDQG